MRAPPPAACNKTNLADFRDPFLLDSEGRGYLVEWPYYQKHAGRLNINGQTNTGYTAAQIVELDALGAQTFLMEEHFVDGVSRATSFLLYFCFAFFMHNVALMV